MEGRPKSQVKSNSNTWVWHCLKGVRKARTPARGTRGEDSTYRFFFPHVPFLLIVCLHPPSCLLSPSLPPPFFLILALPPSFFLPAPFLLSSCPLPSLFLPPSSCLLLPLPATYRKKVASPGTSSVWSVSGARTVATVGPVSTLGSGTTILAMAEWSGHQFCCRFQSLFHGLRIQWVAFKYLILLWI